VSGAWAYGIVEIDGDFVDHPRPKSGRRTLLLLCGIGLIVGLGSGLYGRDLPAAIMYAFGEAAALVIIIASACFSVGLLRQRVEYRVSDVSLQMQLWFERRTIPLAAIQRVEVWHESPRVFPRGGIFGDGEHVNRDAPFVRVVAERPRTTLMGLWPIWRRRSDIVLSPTSVAALIDALEVRAGRTLRAPQTNPDPGKSRRR
jgi:hypothetical protein